MPVDTFVMMADYGSNLCVVFDLAKNPLTYF